MLPRGEQEHVPLVRKRPPALGVRGLVLPAVQIALLGRALMVAAAQVTASVNRARLFSEGK